MRPQAAVILIGNNGSIVDYELYFSLQKAHRAFKEAQKKDEYGFYTLIKEDGGFSSTTDVVARIICFDKGTGTSEDPYRRSFLNLSDNECKKLAAKYNTAEVIIESCAQLERYIVEHRRGYLCNYDEHTKAIMRKWLPQFLLRKLFY